jgi:opacity protein-like surface antigen
MQRFWRPFVLAAVLNVSAGAAVAAAQTVTVRNVPPGSAVDVVLNAATVATGTADASGVATLAAPMKDAIGKTEIDANVFVDVCASKRRVLIVEIGGPTVPPDAGCDRRQISGLYWVRPINTVVVNFAGTDPTLLLIKGRYDVPLPGPDGTDAIAEGRRSWRQSPTGLVLSGGAGLSKFSDARAIACGSVDPCSGDDSGLAYTAGVTYWIARFLGVEGTYVKPKKMTVQGGDSFTFDSTLDADVWTFGGVVGAPIGPARLYGKAGVTYHQATSTTNETINNATQTFAFRTKGFGWLFGGGAEGWITSRVAIFGELGLAKLRGDAEGGGEALIDDRVRLLLGGVRVHIGR